uniref:Uncharacterized protein n=1 Tax=Candidatus Kentrum sp. TUN TaxID=2126343 RepID=A0A451A0G6_9GAMM|nr:MAG: hypothetical protein BECKTUN1418F_GA0071002_11788 [Candidatus Kentron sp. TUN]VFK60833.1 MAG: hypothetical protein BECKTUN1418D_GA0071000_113611 [Candidatus Kentron sp. TUN]VFK68096.1 MAG: hypothetical protein BECKTUN1418E_GA0071001_11797 [Candidatus Kentron sp. TUN]
MRKLFERAYQVFGDARYQRLRPLMHDAAWYTAKVSEKQKFWGIGVPGPHPLSALARSANMFMFKLDAFAKPSGN